VRWGVVTFPGSNDDRDTLHVLRRSLGDEAVALWHKDTDLGGVDCVVLPGGFSYGDYLRCGAIARFSPVMEAVREFASSGGLVLGICNGFQVLCEAGLLPGALVRNRSLRFVCLEASLRVESVANPFTHLAVPGDVWRIPVKHGEGFYVADTPTLDRLERDGRILLRYCRPDGSRDREEGAREYNPNGSLRDIAGVMNAGRNVFGLMPHPEHAADADRMACEDPRRRPDGLKLFQSIAQWVVETRQRASVGSMR
jgi:phosphoribosylformylglycinamidine synthase subunit PurQ / glutaminase